MHEVEKTIFIKLSNVKVIGYFFAQIYATRNVLGIFIADVIRVNTKSYQKPFTYITASHRY